MESTRSSARRLWEAVEPLHAVVYFHPLPTDVLKAIGLRGWWMCYFAGRFAPLGAIAPAPAAAMAFGFAPDMVARALPDAWRLAGPDEVVAARRQAVTSTLRSVLSEEMQARVPELVELLGRAVGGCDVGGRPLAAGWAGFAAGDDLLARLWAHVTVLREHRGDGHVAAATGLGLTGLDTTITHVASGAVGRERIQPSRGWSDAEWDEAAERLQARGWLEADGRLTPSGASQRRRLEDTTDRLAAGPVERLGPAGVERVVELAAPLSRHLIDTGLIPVPNPIGAPRP